MFASEEQQAYVATPSAGEFHCKSMHSRAQTTASQTHGCKELGKEGWRDKEGKRRARVSESESGWREGKGGRE